MTVSPGEGENYGGQPPQAVPDAALAHSCITVGVPLPAEVWDNLLRVWRMGSRKNKKGRDRMNARHPLMAISFPLELYESRGGNDTKEVLDRAAERMADKLSGIEPFRLTLGKVECVPNVDGGWSVVVEAAESADLARLREQVLLLFPQSGKAALFATPSESGFVARVPLATYRSRSEAYATCQRLTALSNSTNGTSAASNSTCAGLSAKGVGPIEWDVKMVVISSAPPEASLEEADLYRVMALGNADAKRCESEYKQLVAGLAAGAGGKGSKSRGYKGVRAPNKDELRVLRQVMGDFKSDFEADKEVR